MAIRRLFAIAIVASGIALSGPAAGAASATPWAGSAPSAAPVAGARVFANCDALHRTYPHGVGRKGARDHVSGRSKPVTNFAVSTAVYNANRKSDRDNDGVACEKR